MGRWLWYFNDLIHFKYVFCLINHYTCPALHSLLHYISNFQGMQINITLNYPLDNKRNIIYANFALAYHELELSFTTLHRFPFLIQTHINMLIKTKTLKIECIIFLLLLFMHFIKANMLLLFLGLSWSWSYSRLKKSNWACWSCTKLTSSSRQM